MLGNSLAPVITSSDVVVIVDGWLYTKEEGNWELLSLEVGGAMVWMMLNHRVVFFLATLNMIFSVRYTKYERIH